MDWLKRLLPGPRDPFRPLERRILQEVEAGLDAGAAELLRRQVAKINPRAAARAVAGGVLLPDAARRVEELETALPPEYLELTEQTEGLLLGPCAVLGLRKVREVVLEEASYWILVEVDGRGILGVRSGASDGMLYYVPFDGDPPQTAGRSLRQAIETFGRAHR